MRIGRTLSILLTLPSVSYAQHWQQVNVPTGPRSLSPYFVTRNYGFLYTSGLMGWTGILQYNSWGSPFGNKFSSFIDPPGLYRTTDGGTTWNPMNLGELSSASHAVITQMRFVSAARGYLTAVVNDTPSILSGGLYETTDSGSSWNRITPSRFGFESLAISGSKILLVKFGTLGNMPDSIVIFDTLTHTLYEVPGAGISIVSNGSSIVYSHHTDPNGYVGYPDGRTMRSTTSGMFWTNTEAGLPALESWSLYALPNSNIVLRVAELVQAGSQIQRSSDGGATWKAVYTINKNQAMGDIDGDGCAIYVQMNRLAFPDTGLLRSTDSGLTWQKVGGPIHTCDSRTLSVVDRGAVVYAIDDSDWNDNHYAVWPFVKLWRTTDGGDGALPRAYNPTASTDTIPKISLCNISRGLVRVFSNRCSVDWELVDASLSGDTIDFKLDSLPALPETFGGSATDSFHVLFSPTNRIGTFTTKLTLRFKLAPPDSGIFDTTIAITANAVGSPIEFAASTSSLDFGPVSTCSGFADTTVVFRNTGCSPDTITRANIIGSDFTDTVDTLPIIVEPGDSVVLHYRFAPTDTGGFAGTVKLHVTSMGLTEDPVISLTGRAVQGTGVLDVRSTSLQAGSFSFCSGDTVLADTLRNTGCDTLVISNMQLAGDSAFMLLSVPDSLLLPGASEIVSIQFAPRVKGAQNAVLTFHERNIVNDPGRDTMVTISGSGLGGTTALALDTTPRDFGALFACQQRDTTVWLANPGCDTLMVDSASFSNGNYASAQPYPIIIPAGDSVPVLITYIPVANEGSDNGAVTFYTNANTGPGTETVPLQAEIIPPVQLHVGLEAPTYAGHDGNVVTFYVLLTGDSGAAAKYLSGVSFDLTHNDNLLTFRSANGLGVTGQGAGTAPLHFTASALGTSDTLGTLTFQVYLTDSSETPLTLTNVAFANTLGLAPDCIASSDDFGSAFTYLYNCGDHELQKFLQSGQVLLSIESIVPNPAQDRITVHVVSAKPGGVSYQLFDALGNCVIDKQAGAETAPLQARNGEDPSASSGQAPRSTSLQLDVSKLPSGIYFIRVASGGYAVSRSVAIER